MNSRGFVHLRLHTEYSLIDGLTRIKPLMQAVSKKGMNAVAVTDFCNLFAVVKVYQSAISSGVKPIFGADFICHDPLKPDNTCMLTLLCQNQTGYKNLTRLVSKAYVEGQYQGVPHLHFQWIASHAEGLIALSGGNKGDIGKALLAGEQSMATDLALHWSTIFSGRFYLEIQRTSRAGEHIYNEHVVQLADRHQLPLVATNDVRFLTAAEFDAHEARVCIHDGYILADEKRPHIYSEAQYLRSPEEMWTLFSDLPQALLNTVEISKRCTLTLELGKNYLPNFPVPKNSSVEGYLSHLAEEGLKQRLERLAVVSRESYEARLKLELEVINAMGFAGYFLIVADFIQWAKNNDVPVGPGRGSGAGSLVAYALKITDLDPLQYDLLFERFLNPERVSMPDFDIDFCMDGRDRVIEYVAQKYGRYSVSQIITFGTMAAKAVIRDVGRVLGHPYGFVDKLAKLIPFELGITLERALEQEPILKQRYDEEEDVKSLLNLALSLEGLTRNAGKHAGGVVIAPSLLTDFTAIYCEEGSTQLVSQFDKDDVEAVGLVKFDFLGLRTLTIIDQTLKIVNRNTTQDAIVHIETIPLDDAETFSLLKACQTTAVFQLESRGMKELINRLQPDCFEEIIALVALFRPGPLQSGMVDDFIDRKHGRARVIYPHPDLEPILKPTYGVILYQEQVMQIAQVLANYTLGAADLLRRAMGKKKAEEMAEQRAIFTAGAASRGVDVEVATSIFDLMEKFAGYGFNKSHSAAYALVAYQTAWLKTHHPAAFMAAVISADLDNTDKVVIFLNECKQMGIKVLPPSILRSHHAFTVLDSKTLIYGLGAIKGIGELAIQSIIDARNEFGAPKGLVDLCSHVDLRRVNKRVFEALIKSGSLDEWGVERASLAASVESAVQQGTQANKGQENGQADFFYLFDEEEETTERYALVKPWNFKERLVGEKETLGFYLSGHPSEPYIEEFCAMVTPIINLNPLRAKKGTVCGLIRSVRRIVTKRGKRLMIINLEDATATIDLVVFSELFDLKEDIIVTGEMLIAQGDIAQDDYNGGVKLTALGLYSVAQARSLWLKCIRIKLVPENNSNLLEIKDLLVRHTGESPVHIVYSNAQGQAQLQLPDQWAVSPTDLLLEELALLLSKTHVEVCY